MPLRRCLEARMAAWPAISPAKALIKQDFHLVLESTPCVISRIGFKYKKIPLFFL